MPRSCPPTQDRHPAAREGVHRGQGGQHVGGQAVVHEQHAVHRRPPGRAGSPGARSRRPPWPARRRRPPRARPAPPGRPGRCGRCAGCAAPAGPAGPTSPAGPPRAGGDPLDPRPSAVPPLPQQGAVAVGDGQVGARLAAQRQLVGVVGLGVAPVPGQVVGVQRGHRHHRRCGGDVGGLVARHLHHPEVGLGRRLGAQGGTPRLPPVTTR